MDYELKPIADQVIVLTGASSGIGLVTARRAAEAGASVFLIARNADALAEVAAGIEAAGGAAGFAVADVGDPDAVNAAAAKAVERFGRIDSWVNIAGVAIYAKLLDTPFEEHERLFRTNYFGVVNGATAAAAHLRKQGGALITVGSIAAQLPSPILGAYAASKHAVKGYIDGLRMEFIADRLPISVTLILPSGVDTPLVHHAASHVAGKPLVPPPAYDPALVADAILDAVQHPRRDVTVGGAGRVQTLLGLHFPAILDRLSGVIGKTLHAPAQPRSGRSILFAPGKDGDERSGFTPARKTSSYTAAMRHPAAIGVGAAAIAAAGIFALNRKRRGRQSG